MPSALRSLTVTFLVCVVGRPWAVVAATAAAQTTLQATSVADVLSADDACVLSMQSESGFVASESRCAFGAMQIRMGAVAPHERRSSSLSTAAPANRTEAAIAETPNASSTFTVAGKEEEGLGPQWPPVRSNDSTIAAENVAGEEEEGLGPQSLPTRSNDSTVVSEHHVPSVEEGLVVAGKEEEGLGPQWPPARSNDSTVVAERFAPLAKEGFSAENAGLGPQQPFRNHGKGWLAGYKQAHLLWEARGEGVPTWVDGPREITLSDSHSHERISWFVPICGGGLLFCCVLILLGTKTWLKEFLRFQKHDSDVASDASSVANESVQGGSGAGSTRTPSEQGSGGQGEPAPATNLYRFATLKDKLMMGLALLLTSVHGATMPMVFFFSDRVFKAINLPNDDGSIPPTMGPHTNRDEETWHITYLYLAFAGIAFCARFGAVVLVNFASDNMLLKLKRAYFSKLLQQGPAWHDVHNAAELSTRFSQDAFAFKDGSGEQLVNAVRAVALFFSSIVLSFHKDWQMALVMTVAFPVAGFGSATAMNVVRELMEKQSEVYIRAGGIAESAFQLIRLVSAFNGQRRTIQAYKGKLEEAESKGIKMGVMAGINGGVNAGVMCFTMSIGLYVGSHWVVTGYDDECWVSDPPFGTCRTGGSIMSTMFTLMWGFTMGLGTLAVSLEIIARGRDAAQRFFHIIDEPLVVELSGGQVLDHVEGAIAYERVRFSYPGRPSEVALKEVSLQVLAGTTAAFVGPSGSGKSTLVSLLLRFYDPQGGAVTLDGHDLRSLQLPWLRSRMALVEQEPVLFGCSIAENIAYGYDGAADSQTIEKAAKIANAHQFVSSLPDKYETLVGERGTQLSGGQKQRIAIARSLIRDPAVLLLDEATSALDTESERIVQEALDSLLHAKQRTTLVIAHRLSTVKAADQIYVLQDGHMVEQGKHSELMAKSDSLYASLAKAQFDSADAECPGNSADTDTPEPHAQALVQSVGSPKSSEKSPSNTGSKSGQAEPAQDADPLPVPKHVSLRRLWGLSKPEYKLYAFGVVLTLFLAFQMPAVMVRITMLVNLFNTPPVVFNADTGEWVPDFDKEQVKSTAVAMCFALQVIGVLGIILTSLQFWTFAKAGEKITTRLRVASLEAMVKQEIAWFDSNNSGALTNSLATDVPAIRGLLGAGLAPLLQAGLMVVVSFTAAFCFSWRFSLCILACVPLMTVGVLAFQYALERRGEKETAAIVSESVCNVKTVSAFGLQEKLLNRFTDVLTDASRAEMSSRIMTAAGTGIASGALFILYACCVVFGTMFVDQGVMAPEKAALSLFMLIGGTGAFAELVRWAERSTEGRAAANRVFELIDRVSNIDPMSPFGKKLPQVQGRIEFRDIHFWYPTRPEVRIFKGFTLTIEPNTTTALVGHSGSGKSTVVGLLQRFYDPQQGLVMLDGHNLRDLNLAWLRSQMGLVQQEPGLMQGSVLDNICYGLNEVSEERAIEAAKLANAHTFIMQLPNQYHTSVGVGRSSQFSGGQKQRIAIARAIVRDPAVLLLDEATSALDAASERVVQDALDQLLATVRRTTIVIAHRLSTVRNADQICVVSEGEILEQGRHEELIADPNGHYSRLVSRQVASPVQPVPTADKASKSKKSKN